MAITEDLGEFAALVPTQGRLLGLDLGTKTIGLALSNVTRMIASPFETVRRRKFTQDIEQLRAIIDNQQVGGLVLGLPRNLNNTEGPRAQSTRAFARNTTKLIDLPILLWDERLTTAEAERALIAADTSRAKRADVIDQVAASIILQNVLEALTKQKSSDLNTL
ncbi:MAG: Holliday junction resolvase RuvX [Hyphomicrobiaceae bacterium TMED74]|nr:Holliday junction resolvase RuvX [Filomicrobium sp.]RPG35659.1 MAG: Holliday junction resolvase RuvX [Hyphomicrobiaceae bacterium TMED74]